VSAMLEIEGATKRFGGIVANDAVSLAVPRGAIVGLIGPNGSGKTTLFNSIVGQHALDAGSIRFEGRDIGHLRVPQIARLGLMRTFQQTRVFKAMTCLDNMAAADGAAGRSLVELMRPVDAEARGRAEALLEFCGLHAKRHLRAGELSFGQQKLLEFAMALMARPTMLLLDEPTAGINPTLINGLIERLKRANEDLGITLLVIEHNMRVIMNLAGHIHCLAHGRLLASGTPEEIRADRRVIDAYLGAA
jgi:ABC-type branched-subunit amino acid transport system ATPase component